MKYYEILMKYYEILKILSINQYNDSVKMESSSSDYYLIAFINKNDEEVKSYEKTVNDNMPFGKLKLKP